PGLTAWVSAMTAGDVSTVLEPDPSTAAPDAYPLTVLTYAAAAPLALDAAARDDYATFVEYAAGAGQVSGRELGQLPPGYVSLPPALQAQAVAAARTIRELQAAPTIVGPPNPATGGPPLSSSGTGAFTRPSASASGAGAGATPAVAPAPAVEAAVTTTKAPTPSGLLTPILALARNRFVLPGLAGIALLSGLGALEITKRPRRRPGGPVEPAVGAG
ncbi:MAG: hypothetical protein ABIX10_00330, partial [Acidimicrobiales bacterium]